MLHYNDPLSAGRLCFDTSMRNQTHFPVFLGRIDSCALLHLSIGGATGAWYNHLPWSSSITRIDNQASWLSPFVDSRGGLEAPSSDQPSKASDAACSSA